MADKKLAQLEFDKFLRKDSSNDVSPIAVVNPDGSNVGGTVSVSLGNITLNPGPNHIGSVTIYGTVQSTPGMTTLFPGPNQIGSVTVSNTVNIADGGGSITVDWVSGATVGVSSLPVLPTGSNWIGLVTANIVGTINTGMTTLFPGPNQIGSVTVSHIVSTLPTGNVTLNGSPNQIGSVTISNNPTLGAGANYIGLVTVANTVPVTGTFWQTTQPISFTGNVTLNPSPSQIGSVTISNNPTLGTGTNLIGLVTVANTINTLPSGNVTLNGGPNQIGSVTISHNVNVIPVGNVSLNASNAFIGLVTVSGLAAVSMPTTQVIGSLNSLASIYGTVGITTGANYIGLVTVVPTYLSTYTSFATVISAAGNSTLFLPPSNQRWVLKDLLIGSQGQTQVGITSGTNTVIPPIALATMGGYMAPFGDSGIRGKAQNDAFVIVNNSAVTISVTANVRFDS